MRSSLNEPPSRWSICLRPADVVRLRLFCFPSAGGGPAQYRLWPRVLPHDFEIHAVQLPGRETRLREPPMRRMAAIIEAVGQAIIPLLDQPFALFGHSMGALLAFEVTRWLRRQGAPMPLHLFISGRRAPQMPDPAQALHTLDDAAFVREIVARYNGIPQVILEDRELLQLFLPTLRADLEVIETYEYVAEEPLDCAISAFSGFGDRQAPRGELESWGVQTWRAFRARQFAGDHFYLQDERPALLSEIVGTLSGGVTNAHWSGPGPAVRRVEL